MGKCVVSGCPNRIVSYNRGVFNRAPRRFFNFPKDPNRVKVWLAALRETDQDVSEQLVICEDHFLPEDVSKNGLLSDAIPVTPPFFDRPLSLMRSGGAESEEEDEQWAYDEEEEDGAFSLPPFCATPNPSKQDPGGGSENAPVAESVSGSLSATSRHGTPLSLLTRGFLELLLVTSGGSVDLRQAAGSLQAPTRRVRSVVDVLEDMGLVRWESDSRVSWIGDASICSFLWRSPLAFLTALEKLQLVERKLDRLIRSCSQQLLNLTEDVDNAAWAYVRSEDIARIAAQDQTVIVIKAPPETRLDVPEPQEDRIQLHLRAEKSPITAMTFELDLAPVAGSGPTGHRSVVFAELESRIGARSALSDSCDWSDDDARHKADSEAVWRKTGQMKTAGQTYTVQTRYLSGQPDEMGPPCRSVACSRSSKHACSSITEEDREKIFTCFWEDMTWTQRQNYMCSLVDVTPVQRRRGTGWAKRQSSLVFNLSIKGQKKRVCRNLFLGTFGVKEWMALKWIREKKRRSAESEEEVPDCPAGASTPAAS